MIERESVGMTQGMTDSQARGMYEAWMTTRRCRPTTIYGSRRALLKLAAWASGVDLLSLTHDDLYRWQADRAAVLLPDSQRSEMSKVRQYYRWLAREGLMKTDPTSRLDLPRSPRRAPRPAKDTAIRDALDAADEPTAAILGLAALAGLRCCEVARLDWGQVDLAGSIWIIDGKAGNSRQVPVGPLLAQLLEALPARRGPVIPRGDGLAGHNSAGRISARANRALRPYRVTAHQLRHRYCTRAYQASLDLRATAILAGHASTSTTSTYAAPQSRSVAKAARAAGRLAA